MAGAKVVILIFGKRLRVGWLRRCVSVCVERLEVVAVEAVIEEDEDKKNDED